MSGTQTSSVSRSTARPVVDPACLPVRPSQHHGSHLARGPRPTCPMRSPLTNIDHELDQQCGHTTRTFAVTSHGQSHEGVSAAVVAEAGLVLASAAPVRPGPDVVGWVGVSQDQVHQQAPDLR